MIGVVNSILNQSYLPDELIIVDQSIGMELYNNVQDLFSKVNPSFELIYVHNSEINGLVSAKHHGVQISSGDIISFLEDDVSLSTNCLKNVVSVFEKNEKILGCSGVISNIRRNIFYVIPFEIFHRGIFYDKRVDIIKYQDCEGEGMLIQSDHIIGGTSSYRKEVV